MRGSILIELMVAFSVFALTLAAIAGITAGSASAADDLAAQWHASAQNRQMLNTAAAAARTDFESLKAASTSTGYGTSTLAILYESRCLAIATAATAYALAFGRTATETGSVILTDATEAVKLGNDCETETAPAAPIITASSSLPMPGGTATAIDALDGIVYIGLAQPPYLAIADARAGLSRIAFTNGFALPAAPNDLDAIAWSDGDGTHVTLYAALASTTNQFAAIDATDPQAPTTTLLASLKGIVVSGSYPQGWRIRYYGGRVYEVTREMSGPELHVFSVDDPTQPRELGSGTELNTTVNGLVVRDQSTDKGIRRYIFVAAERLYGEFAAYDATDPDGSGAVSQVKTGRINLYGNSPYAESIELIGDKAYLGRETSSADGNELYVFDVTDPEAGLPIVAQSELNRNVLAIRAWGPYELIEMPNTSGGSQSKDIQLLTVSTSTATTRGTETLSGMPGLGLDLDGNRIYAFGYALGKANTGLFTYDIK